MTACPASGVRLPVHSPYTYTYRNRGQLRMSISGGGQGKLSDAYGDIESQLFVNTARVDGDGGTGSNANFADQTITETPTGDLDRNELAELLYVRIVATTSVRDIASDSQSQTGNVRNDVEAFINEIDQQEQPNVELQEFDGSSSDFRPGVKNDAAGTITQFNQVVHPQAFGANGEGAGPDGGETTVVEMPYYALGGGPILDRFDDVGVAVKVSGSNVVTEFGTETRMQCWYRVDEFEDRPTFGRP